jgi:hypothetical protein
MLEPVMFWNEPNNKSHRDPKPDPGFARFAEMTPRAGQAVAEASPGLTRVLGGLRLGALDAEPAQVRVESGLLRRRVPGAWRCRGAVGRARLEPWAREGRQWRRWC